MISSCSIFFVFFFFKQKTAYEMRISDWSSDVCASDLAMDCVYLPAETKVVYLWLARTCQSVSKDSRLHYRSSRGRGTAIRGVSISLVTFESWHRRRSATINTLPLRWPLR